MGAYAFDGTTQQAGALRAWDGTAWTAESDAGYAWDGTAWQQFQPLSTDSELLAPQNVSATPAAYAGTITWTNPDQDLTPTDIQFRVPEGDNGAWTELPYPTTQVSLGFLTPSTSYQFQIRYIIRANGSVTDVGPIAEVFFSTTAPTGPGSPAPDPGGSGPDSVVTWPVPSGGASCDWEYIVQLADTPDVGVISYSDTAVTGTLDGEIGEFEIDFVAEGLACGGLARWKYREVCGGSPGDWQYSLPFILPCDWDQPCAGVITNGVIARSPYDDANLIMLLPQVCLTSDNAFRIEDGVTAQEYRRDPFIHSTDLSQDNWVLVGSPDSPASGGPLVSGYNSNLADIDADQDCSFGGFIMLKDQPPTDLLGGARLLQIGRTINFRAYEEGAGFRIGVVFPKEGGGAFSLQSTEELALDTYHHFMVTIDANGNKVLYINGVEADTDTDTTSADFDGTGLTSEVALFATPWSRHKIVAGWDRVLSAAEVLDAATLGVPGLVAIYQVTDASGPVVIDILNGDLLLLCEFWSRADSVDPLAAYNISEVANNVTVSTMGSIPQGRVHIDTFSNGRMRVVGKSCVVTGASPTVTFDATDTSNVKHTTMILQLRTRAAITASSAFFGVKSGFQPSASEVPDHSFTTDAGPAGDFALFIAGGLFGGLSELTQVQGLDPVEDGEFEVDFSGRLHHMKVWWERPHPASAVTRSVDRSTAQGTGAVYLGVKLEP